MEGQKEEEKEYLLMGCDEVFEVEHRLDAALACRAHPPPYAIAESSTNGLRSGQKKTCLA